MAGGMRPGRGMLWPNAPASAASERGGSPRRHCWVTGPEEDPGPWPGLILDWQRADTGWRAWVVYLIGPSGDVVVQGWVVGEKLAPVD